MLLGLDLGTGSLKALLLSEDGQVLGEASRAYAVTAPRPGYAETDPLEWWHAAGEAVQEAVGERGSEVRSIGLSGQMHGVVLCKPDGMPLRNAVLWADTRSALQLDLYRALSAYERRRLGNPIVTGMAGPTLLWLQSRELLYWNAAWALQPKDWLRLCLTGRVCAEPSDASATLLYDLEGDGWFDDLIDTLGLRRDLLPPLQPSSAVAGELSLEAARHLGLRAGTPVATGAGDTAAAMLGSGLIHPGPVQLSVGSGAQLVAPLDRPKVDLALRTHLYRGAVPGRWYAMAAMQNAGLALEWVRKVLGLSWEQAYEEAFAVPAGAEGLTFLPFLTGERTPHMNPAARGEWAGLGLHHGRGHLMRSALEGVAFAIREGMEALEANDVAIPEIRLAGGGTADPRWRQLLSDVLGRPLLATDVPSASARGAALLGGMAVGVYAGVNAVAELAPRPVRVAEPQAGLGLEAAYRRYRELYKSLKGWFEG